MIIDRIFFTLFSIEAIIKIVVHQRDYFRNYWNIFDFTILSLTLILLLSMAFSDNWQLRAGLRILRTSRLMKLLNFKSLRLLIDSRRLEIISHALADAAPVLAAFGILYFFQIYMFAIIGMHSFAMLDLTSTPGINREMSQYINFQNFKNAFVTLLRLTTGEAWNSIMFEASWQKSILYQCNEDETFETIIAADRDPQDWQGPKGCGNFFGAILFFNIFNLFVTLIYLNVVVAVIVDAFSGSSQVSKLPFGVKLMEECIMCWAKFDPEATYFITIQDLDKMVEQLAKLESSSELFVYQHAVESSSVFRRRLIGALEIPMFDNFKKVMFYDVLQQLIKRAFKLYHNKELIESNLMKLRVTEMFSRSNTSANQHILIEDIINLNTDFLLDFDEATIKHLAQIGKRIDLISMYKQKTL